MPIKMKIETPIAFGLTLTVCLVLFFYCWRIRRIRNRLNLSVQVSALPTNANAAVLAEEQAGIKTEVIATFPTVKAHDLKDDTSKEGCPICLVEYTELSEVLRKLPLCNHVFHIRCVDPWLANQVTCPVCRIVLTEAPLTVSKLSHNRRHPAADSVTVEVPAWVLVNRPVPLPPAVSDSPSRDPSHRAISSTPNIALTDPITSPLLDHGLDYGLDRGLDHSIAGWGAVFLENNPNNAMSFRTSPQCGPGSPSFRTSPQRDPSLEIQTKECIHHDSISERWMTESFLFGISGDSEESVGDPKQRGWRCNGDYYSSQRRHASWSSRSVNSSSWDGVSQQAVVDEVLESRVAPFRPLTMSPERCSFEFMPIVTGDYSSVRSPRTTWVGASRHTFYSQL